MARPDPLGQAMLAYQRGEYERGDLIYRDGAETREGHVEEYYFGDPFDPSEFAARRHEFVDGPVLDAGCGAGRDALYFQEHYDTLAVDVSPGAVRAARERGVENAEVMDMFDLAVADGAFRTVYVTGTQASLASSLVGLSALLAEFARVTDADGRAVVDMLDPTVEGFEDAFGYRPDFRRGMARRCFHFEYRQDRYGSTDENDDPTEPRPGDTIGPTLDFLLVDPERFREAVAATEWSVTDVLRREGGSAHYALVMEK